VAPYREAALVEETFKAQTEVPPVQIDNAAAMDEGAKTEVERDESWLGCVLDSYAKTSQVHTVSEK